MELNKDERSQQTVKPAGQVVRPAGQQIRPAGQVVRPAGQVVRPAGQQIRPAGQQARPAGQQPRPAGQQIKTAEQQSRPVGQQTRPAEQEKRTSNSTNTDTVEKQMSKVGSKVRVIKSTHVTFEKHEGKPNYVLYLIVDKPIEGMLQYFRSYGINVSRIFTRIADARNALLMQVDPTKIVLIDTGNGGFNSMSARKDIIDLIGLGDDQNKIVAFYSDTNLKAEVNSNRSIQKKSIDWVKYKTTSGVLAYLLQSYKECNYIADGDYTDAGDITETLNIRLFANQNFKPEKTAPYQINTSDIVSLNARGTNEDEQIQAFNPII